MKARTLMMRSLVTTLALGATAAVASSAVAASSRSTSFDGTWQVRLVTSAGSCAPSYSYTLAIAGGQVRSLGGSGASPTNVSGGVGRDGSVRLAVQHSLAQADASGPASAQRRSGNVERGGRLHWPLDGSAQRGTS